MHPRVLLALIAVAAGPLWAAPLPLDPAAPPESWRERLDALAAPAALTAPFTETRETPVRRRPLVLEGTVRLARGHGLSLDYTRSRAPLVIVDDQGLLLRHADGRLQNPPAEAAESVRLLHALFAFDLATLSRDYEIRGEEQKPASREGLWALDFTRREGSAAHYRELTLEGEGARLTRIRLVRAERHITMIELGEPEHAPGFPPEALARWFR